MLCSHAPLTQEMRGQLLPLRPQRQLRLQRPITEAHSFLFSLSGAVLTAPPEIWQDQNSPASFRWLGRRVCSSPCWTWSHSRVEFPRSQIHKIWQARPGRRKAPSPKKWSAWWRDLLLLCPDSQMSTFRHLDRNSSIETSSWRRLDTPAVLPVNQPAQLTKGWWIGRPKWKLRRLATGTARTRSWNPHQRCIPIYVGTRLFVRLSESGRDLEWW